jgi:hypothetical protein
LQFDTDASIALGASNAGAQRLASGIVGMAELLTSLQQTIKAVTEELTSSNPEDESGDLLDSTLYLEDLRKAEAKLSERIKQHKETLTGKHAPTAAMIQHALKDKFELKVFKCRALMICLCSKVRQALLAAVPFKR